VHRPFADVDAALPPEIELSGMLLDIGFSSPQVDDGARGWSCYQDGPLDLRMNFQAGVPAARWLQTAGVGEVASVLYENGEDDDPMLCSRMAEAILERQRRCGPYTSTLQLSTCVQEVKAGFDDRGQHPAKLAFQGLRNFINQEMQQLADALNNQFRRLKFGGRAVVITFKPREESVLVEFLREHEDGWASPLAKRIHPMRVVELFPLLQTSKPYAAQRYGTPIRTSGTEIDKNMRARSAMVHVLVKRPRRDPPHGFDMAAALAGIGSKPATGLQLVRPEPPPLEPDTKYASIRSVVSVNDADAAAGTGPDSGSPLKPGDWICPRCSDINFARRTLCRLCNMSRPPKIFETSVPHAAMSEQ